MKVKLIVGGAIVVLLLVARFVIMNLSPGVDDVQQVTNLIETARQGAEKGEPNQITDSIAESANVAGWSKKQLVALVNANLRKADEVRVKLTKPDVKVTGDEAVAYIALADISIKEGGDTHRMPISDLQLHLKKQETRKWLFFKGSTWKIDSAETGQSSLDTLLSFP